DSHKAVFYGLNHFEIQYHSSVAEQITRWLYPHVNDYVQDGIQTHIIDMPNYTLEDLEGIVET
ncbi:hypothetical protein Q4024_20525, partial [Acinetobacter baumannii]|nr:hypothetical protein [Acinetobacter baumannii]HCW4380848.1 hypothetical protein [Acinetobacter baumannii]